MAGLMNPDGRKGGLIAVLTLLHWIQPLMLVVSRGGSEVLATLKKVILLKQCRILSNKAFISVHLACSGVVHPESGLPVYKSNLLFKTR